MNAPTVRPVLNAMERLPMLTSTSGQSQQTRLFSSRRRETAGPTWYA